MAIEAKLGRRAPWRDVQLIQMGVVRSRSQCHGTDWQATRYDNPGMSEDNQFIVPPSFIALFVLPGRSKPTECREHIAGRYEFCEDLAQMLTEPASTKKWELGVTERDVLERMHRGLTGEDAVVEAAEAQWVTRRLAELLDWPDPGVIKNREGNETLP